MKNKLTLIACGGCAKPTAGEKRTAKEQYRNAQKTAPLRIENLLRGK
jgi:hypothetical protein